MVKIYKGQKVSDGAGVKLNRVIATQELDHVDPFFLLDEFRSDNKEDYIAGFPMHPHRGIETITYMKKGKFTHRDSKGNEGLLKAGEVQWMTAGKGILHEEMPAMEDGELWGYQLWVNLPAKLKMIEPEYRHIKSEEMPIINGDGYEVKLISGIFNGTAGPVKSSFPVDYMDIDIKSTSIILLAKTTNIIYVHTGEVKIEEEGKIYEILQGNMAVIENINEIHVSGEDAGLLFLSAEAINEPVYRYGPFVMNSSDEIIQAIDDFNQGKY
jgi:redox-sensitive bicupin YhaK (pirin superfamily)